MIIKSASSCVMPRSGLSVMTPPHTSIRVSSDLVTTSSLHYLAQEMIIVGQIFTDNAKKVGPCFLKLWDTLSVIARYGTDGNSRHSFLLDLLDTLP